MPASLLDARPVATDPRYPVELIDVWHLVDGRRVLVRPMLPQDTPLYDAFVRGLAPASRRLRFHGPIVALPEPALSHLVRVDHRDHVALLASVFDGRDETEIAEARYVVDDPRCDAAEFAVAVADAWQGRGIGRRLMITLANAAAAAGVRRLAGDVLPDNQGMLALARSLGARIGHDADSGPVLRAELVLPPTGIDPRR